MCCARWAMAWWTRLRGRTLVVLNTCHIREKAAEKVYSDIGRLKPLKADMETRKGGMTIAVAGCVAQAEGAEIIARAPAGGHRGGPAGLSSASRTDSSFAPGAWRDPGRRLRARGKVRRPAQRARRPMASPPSSPCRRAATNSAPSAWCPIRAARNGPAPPPPLSPRPAKPRLEQGVREITLLGQNVNAYNGVEGGLAALARALVRCARPRPHPLYD